MDADYWGLNKLPVGILGELQSVDGYMNIALENTEEFIAGKMKNRYGDVFIRGNNGPFHASTSCLFFPSLSFSLSTVLC